MNTPTTGLRKELGAVLDELYRAQVSGDQIQVTRSVYRAATFLGTHGNAMMDELGGWRPIDSAPKDGNVVDLWAGIRYPSCKWMVSEARGDDIEHWRHLSWHTTFDDWFWIDIQAEPTHWRPLPQPPTREQTK